jgi:hypothetical protein
MTYFSYPYSAVPFEAAALAHMSRFMGHNTRGTTLVLLLTGVTEPPFCDVSNTPQSSMIYLCRHTMTCCLSRKPTPSYHFTGTNSTKGGPDISTSSLTHPIISRPIFRDGFASQEARN